VSDIESGVQWSSEVESADWIAERLHPFAQDVGSVIPDIFPAYVRLFHPVRSARGNVSWSSRQR
jgi:hypothetical protein